MITEKTITLNKSDWKFCYDWDAQIAAEKVTGQNLLAISGTSSEILQIMTYARLLKYHPEVTLAEVGKLLPGNVAAIAQVLSEIGDFQGGDE